jgi:ketosteroid isomerase-like protein
VDLKSEFAAIEVSVDRSGNGPRLKLEDLKTDHVGYLDALELETLAWLPENALHGLLDPSALRWTDAGREPTVQELVRLLYAALAAGDRDKLLELLAEDFEAEFARGMPVVDTSAPIRSAEDMIERGWWALGRAFRVRVAPSAWIPCAGERLLVLGRYMGVARSTERELEANFVHLWTVRAQKLAQLWHLTDTAAWLAALE